MIEVNQRRMKKKLFSLEHLYKSPHGFEKETTPSRFMKDYTCWTPREQR